MYRDTRTNYRNTREKRQIEDCMEADRRSTRQTVLVRGGSIETVTLNICAVLVADFGPGVAAWF